MNYEILIIDDEDDIRSLISLTLQDEKFLTIEASNALDARKIISSRPPSCIILDIWMRNSDMDGIELLKWCHSLYPELPIVMISGHGNIETAVSSIKMGAYDFLEKPFKAERLILTVKRAIQQSKLSRENTELKSRNREYNGVPLIGKSNIIKQLNLKISKIALSTSRVLITGVSGSGKETVARVLHEKSERKEGPFVLVNCARLSSSNADIELFGSESLDTGRRIVGLFEQAHKGTLFFDEICDLPIDTQGRLVRAVTDQHFRRVGGNVEVSTDVRIISSSSKNLKNEIKLSNFREDLFYRLSVVGIDIPPLSLRREDIYELSNYFLTDFSEKFGRSNLSLSREVINAMTLYDWPGSVRQLKNVVESMIILSDSKKNVLDLKSLPKEIIMQEENDYSQYKDDNLTLTLKEAREIFEKNYLKKQLLKFDNNISHMAKFIGMERSALHRKLKQLEIIV